ncbi:hypothetical protein HaLaN_15391 [Haematococcus lacustris]|uniref:Uncharacterized protein n=1 Tax=Haematococcus lacustris TaxID=44745 RepID=A0A699ZA87_HAELA|nr:hypothetical protein HaLaN_15391 [Haematococcus lacustris]
MNKPQRMSDILRKMQRYEQLIATRQAAKDDSSRVLIRTEDLERQAAQKRCADSYDLGHPAERWLAPIKPHLQHLAAASSAGTSLVANLKHITVTLATWDALKKDIAEVSMERHEHARQLVVFFGAASIGTGAWSQQRDLPVRCLMWCPVVALSKPPQAPRSSQEATQPAASEPGPTTPPPAKRSNRTKAEQAVEGQGKPAKAKPAPQPGSFLASHAAMQIYDRSSLSD